MTALNTPDFRAAILANPHDRDARLIYADWLEERGDPLAAGVRLIWGMSPGEIVHQCNYNRSDSNPGNWDAARAWATIVDAEDLGRGWFEAWGRRPWQPTRSPEHGWFSHLHEPGVDDDADELPIPILDSMKVLASEQYVYFDTKPEAITAAAQAAGRAFRTGAYVCLWPDEADDCFQQPKERQ